MSDATVTPSTGGVFRAAAVLGVAFSGFFDGILLHQVLQWHHLLSLVTAEPFQDPRVQILADGLFHVLMYAVALTGVVMLWRAREELARGGAGTRLLGGMVFGFGLWNIIDVVLFHWVLRIHHIRLDDNPLAWDVGWLVVLGLVPLAAGWRISRGGGHGRGGLRTAAAAGIVVLVAGAVALRPSNTPFAVAMFRPDLTPAEIFGAVALVDAEVVSSDRSGQVLVLRVPTQAGRWALYRHGAMVVGGAGPAGCIGWSRPV